MKFVSSLSQDINFVLKQLNDGKDQVLNRYTKPNELAEIVGLELNNEPANPDEIENFIENYFKYSVNTNHDMYLNQLWSRTEDSSVIGELISALTNTSMYTYEVAPVATLLEKKMVDYLSHLIWQEKADGTMTSGGTASNLQALMVARNHAFKDIKKNGVLRLEKKPIFMAASNAHYSIKRAANILGLGHDSLIEVEVNERGQMTIESVKKALSSLTTDQKLFCLVSTAGTTVEGAYDNLKDLGEFCHEQQIWFHVDGAYGGSALLSSKMKHILNGLELCDSFSWDFHKMLGLNLPCAFLFTKERGILKHTISTQNDFYLFHEEYEENYNLGQSSLQCGRRNDILKLWLTWKKYGALSFEKRVDILFNQAKIFSDYVQEHPLFDLLIEPQSINVCFRFKGDDRKERAVRDKLIKTGRLMVNYSENRDGPFFRFAFTNPNLTKDHLKVFLSILEETYYEC